MLLMLPNVMDDYLYSSNYIDVWLLFDVCVELLHSTSVQNMGNYQEYVKKLPPPMREIETQPARQHTFGNPFKVNKVTKHIHWVELKHDRITEKAATMQRMKCQAKYAGTCTTSESRLKASCSYMRFV